MIDKTGETNEYDGFMTEADLRGQADPTRFFDRMLAEIFADIGVPEKTEAKDEADATEAETAAAAVLVVLEKSGTRRALVHCIEKAGAKAFTAGPSDSYNYMLDVIINEGVCLLISDSAGITGILKHSARLRLDAVIISDRYLPPQLAGSIVEAWGCDVYMHYTRPELAGLGAFGLVARSRGGFEEGSPGEDHHGYDEELHVDHDNALSDVVFTGGGLTVSEEIRIDIIDPETGNYLPCKRPLLKRLIGRRTGSGQGNGDDMTGMEPGDWGEIVVTSLFPASEPMEGYRTGDVSRMLPPAAPAEQPASDRQNAPSEQAAPEMQSVPDEQPPSLLQRIDVIKKRTSM